MVKLLDFYANWCGPCKMMDPILLELEGEWKDKISIEKIDVDAQTDIASQYGVMSIPTYVVVKDNSEVGRIIGYKPKADFKKQIESYI
ncbi:MAG: thioredoxin [bacterium]|nr:thioredoxin [bacterium]